MKDYEIISIADDSWLKAEFLFPVYVRIFWEVAFYVVYHPV